MNVISKEMSIIQNDPNIQLEVKNLYEILQSKYKIDISNVNEQTMISKWKLMLDPDVLKYVTTITKLLKEKGVKMDLDTLAQFLKK